MGKNKAKTPVVEGSKIFKPKAFKAWSKRQVEEMLAGLCENISEMDEEIQRQLWNDDIDRFWEDYQRLRELGQR